MKVLVTGANGMLGMDLGEMLELAGHTVVRTDVSEKDGFPAPPWKPLNILSTQDVIQMIEEEKPDTVIHSAAKTDVDGCERNPDLAYKVNTAGTWNVAAACGDRDIPLTYISTDFVFDGKKQQPYMEMDAPNPLSHYGKSKLAGERLVRQLCRRHLIVRTAWLFGFHGKNFPNTILHLAEKRSELFVVTDQVGCPTYSLDLAKAIVSLQDTPLHGTYHIVNSGSCSWYELARKTLEFSGISHVHVKPIPSTEYSSPTRRPSYSVLRCCALELTGRDCLPSWEEALLHYLRRRAGQ